MAFQAQLWRVCGKLWTVSSSCQWNKGCNFVQRAQRVQSLRLNMSVAMDQRVKCCFGGMPSSSVSFLVNTKISRILQNLAEQRALGSNVYEAIFESLGVNKNDLPTIERAVICANYYPPCLDPSHMMGLIAHSDPTTFTILAQKEVSGLEVKKNGRWIVVKPVPGAFVINLADQIQILPNGEYKSVEHRAVRNSERACISIVCFFGPYRDAKIGPLPQLIDETHPPIYKESTFQDYMDTFCSGLLPRKWVIDTFKEDGLNSEKDEELLFKHQG